MGVPDVPLSSLYGEEYWTRFRTVRLHFRSGVAGLSPDGLQLADGQHARADYYVSGLPLDKISQVASALPRPDMDHSPITGVHLWFDRSVTNLPHATLLEREIQWMFNKGLGRSIQLVMSASRPVSKMSKADVVALCLRELAEFFPGVTEAKLEDAHVVKEMRATISVTPGLARKRPDNRTARPNVFVAGDWTWTGWPSTMEGAVRSGYAAAGEVCRAHGNPASFLLRDIR